MARTIFVAVLLALYADGLQQEPPRPPSGGEAFCEAGCRCDGRRMNCSLAGLRTFPTHIPDTATEVDLSHNSIEGISRSGQSNVIHLNLSNNRISKIVLSAFKSSTALETLNLNCNILCDVSLSTPGNVDLLVSTLRKTSEDVCLPSLKVLSIKKNKLESIPKGLGQLKSLNVLDLSFNKITRIDWEDFHNCTQLTNINLQENKIESIYTEAFQDLKKLQVLNLGYNALRTIAPVSLALLNLPELEVELLGNPWECVFRLCVFTKINGFLSGHIRALQDTACNDKLDLSKEPLSPNGVDVTCESTLSGAITFQEVSVFEGEDAVHICVLAGLYGALHENKATFQWTQPSGISEDKQDTGINHEVINTFVMYKSDLTKEQIHMCMPDMKKTTIFHYTSAKEEGSQNHLRLGRDVTRTGGRARTQEDFTLAVCLSVIITFICAFCLGFFLRPYIHTLCNKIQNTKGTGSVHTHQNQGFSNESLEEDYFGHLASRSPQYPVENKEQTRNFNNSTEDSARVSVKFEDGISRTDEKRFSRNPLTRESSYSAAQHKDCSRSGSETDVEANKSDLLGKHRVVWQRVGRPSITPPGYPNQESIVHEETGSSSVIYDELQMAEISHKGGDELDRSSKHDFTGERDNPKLQPWQPCAQSYVTFRSKNSEQKDIDRDIESSDSDEELGDWAGIKERQHTLSVGSTVVDFPRNGSTYRPHMSTDDESSFDTHEYETIQEQHWSISDCETESMTSDTGRGENTTAVNLHSEAKEHALDGVAPLETDQDSLYSDRESDYVSCREDYDRSGALLPTFKSITFHLVVLKYPQFVPRTLGGTDCTNQLVDSESTAGLKYPAYTGKGQRYSISDIQTRGCCTESFSFEDSSSIISYDDSGTDEGSSFRFSPSSSFSGSEFSTHKAHCSEPGSDSSITDQSLTGKYNLSRMSYNRSSKLSPSQLNTSLVASSENNAGTEESRTSTMTEEPTRSNSEGYHQSEQDIPLTKYMALTEAGSSQLHPNLADNEEAMCHLKSTPSPFPVKRSSNILIGTNSGLSKENLEQLSEADITTQMFYRISSNDPSMLLAGNTSREILGPEEIHTIPRDPQSMHKIGMPDLGYSAIGQHNKDLLCTPQPVDFGSNWATYVYAEPIWQSSGATEEPIGTHVFDSEDEINTSEVKDMQGLLLNKPTVPISQPHAQEQWDSRNICCVELSHSEICDNECCLCKGEMQRPSIDHIRALGERLPMTKSGIENDPISKYQFAEDQFSPLSSHSPSYREVQNNYHLPSSPQKVPKTTEWLISESTVFSESGNGIHSTEQERLPHPFSIYQNLRDTERTITHELVQHDSTPEHSSVFFVKKRSVFDGFVSSLQSENQINDVSIQMEGHT